MIKEVIVPVSRSITLMGSDVHIVCAIANIVAHLRTGMLRVLVFCGSYIVLFAQLLDVRKYPQRVVNLRWPPQVVTTQVLTQDY